MSDLNYILECFAPQLMNGKAVLVAGGTSGIGLDIARGFAGLGANVIAAGSSESKLAALREKERSESLSFSRLDVTEPGAITSFAQRLKKLDVLVNAQGVARSDDEYDDATFLQVLDVNLVSMMRLSMALMPLLVKSKGSIINIASMLSYLAGEEVPAYCASKSGVLGLTRALAHRYGPQGVRVNAIAPGYHRTAMTRTIWTDPDLAGKVSARTALKRWGETDDLVGAAVFLATPAAQYITGTTLPVDGGYVIG